MARIGDFGARPLAALSPLLSLWCSNRYFIISSHGRRRLQVSPLPCSTSVLYVRNASPSSSPIPPPILNIDTSLLAFSLQPVLNTRKQQCRLWGDLILEYCRYYKIHELDLEEALSTSPLFNNKQINRKLNMEALRYFLRELELLGNAKWLSKDEKRVRIIWRTNEQWGTMIYNYISEKSMFNTVCSIYELREQDTVEGQEFYMLDLHVFMAALATLQKQGLCQVFEGSTEDSTSVKFFSG